MLVKMFRQSANFQYRGFSFLDFGEINMWVHLNKAFRCC